MACGPDVDASLDWQGRFALAPIAAARPQGAAWPAKPVRIIVPAGPGGVTDIRARWLADRLAPALGQPVVVENRGGAGGNLGTVAGARSAPDGYTLVIIHIGTMAINPHIYANPGYDPLTDLAPITRLGVGPQVLVVHKGVPANSLAELVSLAKAKPGELSFNSPGVGTPGHLASSLLMHLTGIRATHIPYKSGGQAALDVVGGHVTWTIDGPTVLKPFIEDGRLRPLAVTTARRAKSMPDVPTMAEAGVPGYDFTAWAGIAAPAGTPQPVIARLYGEMAKILATPTRSNGSNCSGPSPAGDSRSLCRPGARRKRQARRSHSRPGDQGRVGAAFAATLRMRPRWLLVPLWHEEAHENRDHRRGAFGGPDGLFLQVRAHGAKPTRRNDDDDGACHRHHDGHDTGACRLDDRLYALRLGHRTAAEPLARSSHVRRAFATAAPRPIRCGPRIGASACPLPAW